jgi:hypothetical protein
MAKAEIEQLPQPCGFDDAIYRLEDTTVTGHLEGVRDLDDAARRNRELVSAGQFDRGRAHTLRCNQAMEDHALFPKKKHREKEASGSNSSAGGPAVTRKRKYTAKRGPALAKFQTRKLASSADRESS